MNRKPMAPTDRQAETAANMCHRKVAYETRRAAVFFAQSDGMRAYRCPLCGRWHLTSRVLTRAGR